MDSCRILNAHIRLIGSVYVEFFGLNDRYEN